MAAPTARCSNSIDLFAVWTDERYLIKLQVQYKSISSSHALIATFL